MSLYVATGYLSEGYVDAATGGVAGMPVVTSATVLELDLDYCSLAFGVAPCAATGEPCYNTYATCKDKANYARGVKTLRFCSRGMLAPAGETLRPYIDDVSMAPTEIKLAGGLAVRPKVQVTLVDEPDSDRELDKYAAGRSQPAAGTFFSRLKARNPYAVGRQARVLRGFVAEPFSWDNFVVQRYVIESVAGPDAKGVFTVRLSDPLKPSDRAMVPAPSAGALAAPLVDYALVDRAVTATILSITLPEDTASPLDDAYTGMELYVIGNTGAGQRRVITGYVGATHVATIATPWSVIPDGTSEFEISPLALTLATGAGQFYKDPAVTGEAEFVRLGKEVVRYTAKAGDVLSWPDATHRAQFGSTRESHEAVEGVQQCRAWIDAPPAQVVLDLVRDADIDPALIDTDRLYAEQATWLANLRITTCISEPTKASVLLDDLLLDLNASLWWDETAQLGLFKVAMPEPAPLIALLDHDRALLDTLRIEALDAERINEAAMWIAKRDHTSDGSQDQQFARGYGYRDLEAMSANEYGDRRTTVRRSRWLNESAETYARALVVRKVAALRDAPLKLTFSVRPESVVPVGGLAELTTDRETDAAGAPRAVRLRVTRVLAGDGQFDLQGLSVKAKRYGFIAPAGQPDYGAASEAQRVFAYICDNTGVMSNGEPGYRII